jgi:ABC-type sugar transport system ATPase subunit
MAQEIFDKYGFHLNPAAPVMSLSPANQQLVEICKAISNNAKILILDEPTAALASNEVELLFEIIRKLKSEGVSVIYISHRLDEVFEMSDKISILRDGKYVTTLDTAKTNRGELIALMVGRELGASHPPRANKPSDEVVLKAENITGNSVENISFELHKGEILGVAGLVGAGRTETAELICGSKRLTSGKIYRNGVEVKIHSPSDAIKNGIGLIPEERKRDGCIMHSSVLFNTTLICSKDYTKGGVMNGKKRRKIAEDYKKALKIKVPDVSFPVGNLSGGNQQKVVVAKTMAANLDVIFFDEPTKGIDVGAKYEIYQLMNEMTSQGKSIVMISSDMEEILGVSDRILVLAEGEISGELTKEQFSQENVLTLASGLKLNEGVAV